MNLLELDAQQRNCKIGDAEAGEIGANAGRLDANDGGTGAEIGEIGAHEDETLCH